VAARLFLGGAAWGGAKSSPGPAGMKKQKSGPARTIGVARRRARAISINFHDQQPEPRVSAAASSVRAMASGAGGGPGQATTPLVNSAASRPRSTVISSVIVPPPRDAHDDWLAAVWRRHLAPTIDPGRLSIRLIVVCVTRAGELDFRGQVAALVRGH
jgi:hypothetical protein